LEGALPRKGHTIGIEGGGELTERMLVLFARKKKELHNYAETVLSEAEWGQEGRGQWKKKRSCEWKKNASQAHEFGRMTSKNPDEQKFPKKRGGFL